MPKATNTLVFNRLNSKARNDRTTTVTPKESRADVNAQLQITSSRLANQLSILTVFVVHVQFRQTALQGQVDCLREGYVKRD